MENVKSEERTWAALVHIMGLAGGFVPFGNVFGPLIMWQLKKEVSKFVDDNGKAALNFQISFTIYIILLLVLFFILFFSRLAAASNAELDSFPFGIFMFGGLFLLLALSQFTLMIIATIKASNGEHFKYPLTIKFVK